MLNREQNELLTRVGAGTPMGAFLREYWMPAILSAELPEPDGQPVSVRLLGEDLIAFRETSGHVNLVGKHCPHRGASLLYGRNEQGGIRCTYHGWKFDGRGRCVDMPTEATHTTLKDRLRHIAYPCVERNGLVWTYMGPRDEPPPLPEFEWNIRADNVPALWRNYRHCNWLQAMEGDLDTAHVNFLHGTVKLEDTLAGDGTVPGHRAPGQLNDNSLAAVDQSPRLDVVDTDCGVLYTAKRNHASGGEYHRIHPFLFPFWTMVGGGLNADNELASFTVHGWVPIDDENTLVLEVEYRPDKPWTDDERREMAVVRNPHGFMPATDEPGSGWRIKANKFNNYLHDYELQQKKLFLGIVANVVQDAAMQESMGAIYPRWNEHLGSTDAMIVRVRRRLLQTVQEHAKSGEAPPGTDNPAAYLVRPAGMFLPHEANWLEASQERRKAFYRAKAPAG